MTERVLVTGAQGSLGANVARAALSRGLPVRALVRSPGKAPLPDGLEVVRGDALDADALARAADGCAAIFHLVNVSLDAQWIDTHARLLDAALSAAKTTGARLVFPANVWVYGKGKPGDLVDEARPPSPCSAKGRARAAMEATIRASGARFVVVRLPEFYGPHVQTLTGPPLRKLTQGRTATWFGPADRGVELVFMPDAALALLEIGLARERDVDGEVFHLPGSAHTTARAFLAEARRQTGRGRVVVLPSALVRVGALAVPLAREFADILHLWEAPVLLDGAKLRARFRATRFTPYADGIAQTLAWLRENPGVRMYF